MTESGLDGILERDMFFSLRVVEFPD
jgi:hypothetical protein